LAIGTDWLWWSEDLLAARVGGSEYSDTGPGCMAAHIFIMGSNQCFHCLECIVSLMEEGRLRFDQLRYCEYDGWCWHNDW